MFSLIAFVPGDVALTLLGPEESDPVRLAQIREELGLDRPLIVRYFDWLAKLSRGDLGYSYVRRMQVNQVLSQHIGPTVFLGLAGIAVMLGISVPAGLISALKRGTKVDAVITLLAMLGVGIPSFWLGVMLILVVSVKLGWLPPTGYISPLESVKESIRHIILPAITLGSVIGASMTRFVRSSIVDVLGKDYIRTARAKGLSYSTVVWKHAMRNAMVTITTVLGLRIAIIIGGTAVIETIFAVPGMGRLLVDSILQRDYVVVQGVVLLVSLSVLIVNIAVDVIYTIVDPRIRYN